MTIISPETLKDLKRIIEKGKYPVLPLDTIKQLIHDAKVARVAVEGLCRMKIGDNSATPENILKELDELEKE